MTHPDAIITYHASNVIIVENSDASYISKLKSLYPRRRALLHVSRHNQPSNNGDIITITQIIKNIMSSAAEAKLGALFINCQEVIPVRHALKEMGHKKSPTPMQTDNKTALGVNTNNIAAVRPKYLTPKKLF
mmetsp:Transcript_29739/g.63167  ORF Transcript_29739/g.63167 Transcript_29739/m.63167 type:complete len:132 (+) Transcript_29739:59-454(+)